MVLNSEIRQISCSRCPPWPGRALRAAATGARVSRASHSAWAHGGPRCGTVFIVWFRPAAESQSVAPAQSRVLTRACTAAQACLWRFTTIGTVTVRAALRNFCGVQRLKGGTCTACTPDTHDGTPSPNQTKHPLGCNPKSTGDPWDGGTITNHVHWYIRVEHDHWLLLP
jgi:hypothetical protein